MLQGFAAINKRLSSGGVLTGCMYPCMYTLTCILSVFNRPYCAWHFLIFPNDNRKISGLHPFTSEINSLQLLILVIVV